MDKAGQVRGVVGAVIVILGVVVVIIAKGEGRNLLSFVKISNAFGKYMLGGIGC